MRYLRLIATALILGGSATACRSGTPFEEEGLPDTSARLVVKNENIYQMDVYAVAAGVATRIGTVSGLANKSFNLDQTFYQSSDFSIVATPFGGNGRASTGPLHVSRGQTITFTVRTTLRSSTVAIDNP